MCSIAPQLSYVTSDLPYNQDISPVFISVFGVFLDSQYKFWDWYVMVRDVKSLIVDVRLYVDHGSVISINGYIIIGPF